MSSHVFRLTIFLFLLSPSSALALLGASKIDTVDPGYVTGSRKNVVILSGKGLDKVNSSCVVEAVQGTSGSKDTNCTVEPIKGGHQAKVSFTLHEIDDPQDFLLTLREGAGATLKTVAWTTIRAFPPRDQEKKPSLAKTTTSAVSGVEGPYATCLNGNASAQQPSPQGVSYSNVNCASSLLTDTEVSDNFGGHFKSTYYAIQVKVSNQNSQYDFLLRDVLLTLPDGRVVSGRIRRFAQGVSLKGKSHDARAIAYNSLQAGTGLYGGLAIFASTGFKTVGNVLQGSFLSGFAQIFPDNTSDNVNRFNTAVFDDQNPAIVPKGGIGQPPLYVIALVPKTSAAANTARFGQRIGVSIEGTFIKQVSLVSISPASLDFGRELISPPGVAKLLNSASSGDENPLVTFRSVGQPQQITISNNNSSVMNISKIDIIANNSLDPARKDDFVIDPKMGTCGHIDGSGSFDGKSAFSVPAQGFCTLFVRFQPQGLSDSSANLVVEGNNLDGSKTVLVTGKSIGLAIDWKNLTVSDKHPPSQKVACSTHQCGFDLGLVDRGKTKVIIPIKFLGSNDTVTATQDGATPIPGYSCTGSAETTAIESASCPPLNFTIPSSTSANLTTISFVNANRSWSVDVVMRYSTQATEIMSIPPIVFDQGSVTPIAISVMSSKVPVSKGSLQYSVAGGISKEIEIDADNKTFQLDLGDIAAGTYLINLVYKGQDGFADSIGSASVTVNPRPKASLRPDASLSIPDVPVGGSQPPLLSLTVSGNSTVNNIRVKCSGQISYQVQDGSAQNVSLNGGAANVPLTASKKGNNSVLVNFAGSPNCSAADPVTYHYNAVDP